ncbi:MAG TPA: chemotaxis protein CheW [Telluria sp.]|nr:chemotaxis protein CheW [Telluria sp.]
MNALLKTRGNPVQAAPAAAEPAQYLTFMLSGEVYAIGILGIKEIIEFGGVTTVPMMPDCIRGVINLRGAVVPVMDLAARFGRPGSEITKRTCVVIVETAHEGEQQVVGVMVDAVNAVLEIAAADIEPAPAFGARVRPDFIAGMGKVNGKFVILLSTEHVLSSVEIGAMVKGAEAVVHGE